MDGRPSPNLDEVVAELERLGYAEPDPVALPGGHWSAAFSFETRERRLVIRFGHHVSDYRKDAFAARFGDHVLPIPAVHLVERAELDADMWIVISDFVPGRPLEDVEAAEWTAMIPAMVDLFERLRYVSIPGSGWGSFDERGNAPDPSWHAHLTSASGFERRPADWYERLCHHPVLRDAHDVGLERLRLCDLRGAARSLVHGDLINKNVHADDGRIRGVFDWGCGRFGDHVYELAWLRFWAPWHTNLDVESFEHALHRRWHDDGSTPERFEERMRAALLHIGLDHVIYSTTIDNPSGGHLVAQRMETLRLL